MIVWLFVWIGFVLLLLVFGLAAMIGQWTGAPWAYRVGIPFATYHRSIPPSVPDGGDDSLIIVEKGERYLLRDSVRRLAPDSFVGTIEPSGSGARLRLVTNMNTTVAWIGWTGISVGCLIAAVLAPNASSSDRLVVLLPIVLALGFLWFFVRRARKRADEYADRFGFSPAPSRSGAV